MTDPKEPEGIDIDALEKKEVEELQKAIWRCKEIERLLQQKYEKLTGRRV